MTESTLGEMFFKRMKKFENCPGQFIDNTDEVDTYGDILLRSIRTALVLKDKNNIKPGDIIGLCSNINKNSIVPVVAGQLLGAINANFAFNHSHASMISIMKNLKPKVMFVDENIASAMEDCLKKSELITELVVLGSSDKYTEFDLYLNPHEAETNFRPIQVVNNKETSIILFSSGTTGEPKSICLSHYTLIKHAISQVIFPRSKNCKQDVYLSQGGLNWIAPLSIFIKSVLNGGARIVYDKLDNENVWKIIEKYQVNYAFLSPIFSSTLLDNRPESAKTTSLEVFLTGGSLIQKKLMEDLKRAFPGTFVTQALGQTEAGGVVALFISTDEKHVELQNKRPRSCGKIWKGYQWKIVDVATDKSLGANQPGELRIKSDFLMNGYYNMDSTSAYDSEGYFKTGDIFYYDEDDCMYFVDRMREMLKYKSYQIFPASLEEILLQHPSIKEAIVVGIPDDRDGQHPMAVVVLKNDRDRVTAEEIKKFVDDRVYDTQKLRAGVKIVKELLKSPTGKYQRKIICQKILEEIGKDKIM